MMLFLHFEVDPLMTLTTLLYLAFFFFQAEDGIRDHCVTGVQTCALPIFRRHGAAREAPDLRQRRGPPARVRLLWGEPGDSGGRHLHSQDPEHRATRSGAEPLRSRGARWRGPAGQRRGRGPRRTGARRCDAFARRRRDAGNPMTTATAKSTADDLIVKAQDRSALIGIVGLGYVGLPLAMEFARVGFRVLGFDVSEPVVDGLRAGRSH